MYTKYVLPIWKSLFIILTAILWSFLDFLKLTYIKHRGQVYVSEQT